MVIDITGKNVDLTDALQTHIREKFSHVVKFWSDKIQRVKVELSMHSHGDKGATHVARAWVHVPGKDISASHETSDMYESIDLLLPKIERQIKEYKARLQHMDRAEIRSAKYSKVDEDGEE